MALVRVLLRASSPSFTPMSLPTGPLVRSDLEFIFYLLSVFGLSGKGTKTLNHHVCFGVAQFKTSLSEPLILATILVIGLTILVALGVAVSERAVFEVAHVKEERIVTPEGTVVKQRVRLEVDGAEDGFPSDDREAINFVNTHVLVGGDFV